jgi:hypothetical protein
MTFVKWYRTQFPQPSPGNPEGKPSPGIRLLMLLGLGISSWALLIGLVLLVARWSGR